MTKRITPATLAGYAIIDVMSEGSAKDGRDDSWKDKPKDYHLDRALRHIVTYKLIRDGNQPPDGDHHLRLALTRLSMALYQDDAP